ncbi:MAG: efflux RND transporter periplasmic adaptor subunit [Desulfovibrionaceae bacterium]|nr:efflux RND transporter periplasmic adaptor subunit [Desulfovibrionaceae bacterium]
MIGALLGLAGLAAVLFVVLRPANDKVRVLKTQKLEMGQVRKILEATGIVKAQVGASVKVGSRSTGVLSRVLVKVGDTVAAGQLVAEIDDRELQAKRREAVARLNLAQAKYDYAEKNLSRRERLVEQKLEPQDTLDQARQDARVARFEAEATRATIANLEVQISYTKIYSPMEGVVSQVASQEGEMVVSGLQVTNLITILDPLRLEMWIYVDETDVGHVRPGLEVNFTVDAYQGRTFHGAVNRIYPEPEIKDNIVYYRALVLVDREQARFLRPEMTTQCRIIVEVKDKVLALPNSALKWVNGEQVVFVRGPSGEVRRVKPEIGLVGLDFSEVLSGLNQGDEVAVQLVLPGQAKNGKGA